MKSINKWVAASVLALSIAPSAKAETFNFTVTGEATATFSLDSTPTPLFDNGLTFFVGSLAGTFRGDPFTFGQVGFAVSPFGGFALFTNTTLLNPSGYVIQALNGPQLFTGTLQAPTFKTGSFTYDHATYLKSDGMLGVGTVSLQISPAAGVVPEPATWAMMILGFGAVGSAMRTAQRRKAFYRVSFS